MTSSDRLPTCKTCGWNHAEGVAHVCSKCERIVPKCKCESPTFLICEDDDDQCEQCWYARHPQEIAPTYRTTCHCGWLHFVGTRCNPN